MMLALNGLWNMVAFILLHVACGDGPQTSSSRPTTGVCNPFSGFRYLKLSNGGPISAAGDCQASWDVHEVMLFAADGAQIFPSVSSPTGTGGPFGPLEAAIDNNTDTFWAGDFDVDMGCDCFKDSSIDGHALVFDMGSVTSVMRIRLYQGYNAWSVSKIRIFCGDDAESFFLQPLSLDIPEDVADIQCTSSGCSVTDSQTPKLQCASMSSLPRILWSCCFVTYLLQLGS